MRGLLIDEFLPTFDVRARYEREMAAPADRVYAELRSTDFARSPVVLALLALRAFPAALGTSHSRAHLRHLLRGDREATLDYVLANGFVLLGERPDEELVLGLVGRFWELRGSARERTTIESFRVPPPGTVRAAWNFRVEQLAGARTLVSTETRVAASDDESRRAFLRYWRVIGPFSGIIRLEMLRALHQAAEEA